MAVMLDRAIKLDDTSEDQNNPYPDVTPANSPWSYDAILKMSHNGIFKGYADGGFHAKDSITRAQMAALMNRISQYIDDNITTNTPSEDTN
jgi:hypothetical protein